MKKINLLLVICSLMLIFTSCENEPYTINSYFIENASTSEIYLSKKYEFNEHSSPFIELKQYDYEEVFSYFVDNGEESSIENAKLNFIVKYKDKYYTITKENLNGPNWSKNYRKDAYLDYKEYPSKSQYNHEAYVFSITDEFMESLTPDEE